jgi:hypothetical protein
MKFKLYVLPVIMATVMMISCKQDEVVPAGRWDMTVFKGKKSYPSWFEIEKTGNGLSGRFVGKVGSVRPLTTVNYQNSKLFFSLPVQWEKFPGDLEFSAVLKGDKFEGTTFDQKGHTIRFEALRAPELPCREKIEWGPEIDLLAGDWDVRNPDSTNGWILSEGILENNPPSTDLVSRKKFTDFFLTAEVYLPEKSNSGIYLRGRYEVQLNNMPPDKTGDTGKMGALYGFLAPDTLFATPGDRWYSFEITLIGRCVTVKLNDILIINQREIPGITGGALDSNEGDPGPIMLQGDHGPVKFRNMKIRPAVNSERV